MSSAEKQPVVVETVCHGLGGVRGQSGQARRHRRGRRPARRRRGVILVLFVLLALVLVGLVALAIDSGYVYSVRREAQVAADSAALAAAAYVPTSTTEATAAAVKYAGFNRVAGTPVTAASVEVQFGTWAPSMGVFTPAANPGNAVRVTVRRDATHAGPVPLFFGQIMNKTGFDVSRSSIAMTTPRDIIFVVDTSASMNDDGEPCWATTLINATYPNVGTQVAQQLYTDLGFGTFPGTLRPLGDGLAGISNNGWNYPQMTKNDGPLKDHPVPRYRIANTDSEATRKTKAYSWVIDYQLKTLMPQAKPFPDSTNAASFAFWSLYLDYMVTRQVVQSTSPFGRPRPTLPVSLPPSASIPPINNLQNGNPSQSLEPPASTTEINSYRDQIGYRTFLQFMLDWGIDDVSNSIYYTQLSVGSSNCSYHNETIDGVSFSMPASEQPMHSIRRALISTTNLIKSRNQSVGDSNQQDRVGLLKIEYVVPPKTILDVALTTNYDSFRNICRTIQSVADSTTSTSLDLHIKLAREQLTSSAQSRANARKIIVVVSDGIVTRPTSSTADIDTYQLQYPWPQYAWFHGVPPPLGVTDPRYEPNSLKRYARNSALMEAHMGSVRGVELYVVKVGYTSHKMMADALAEFGGTTNTANEAPIVTNNPSLYESRIKAVLADIIDNPRGRLVE